jgi:hypothetical protein
LAQKTLSRSTDPLNDLPEDLEEGSPGNLLLIALRQMVARFTETSAVDTEHRKDWDNVINALPRKSPKRPITVKEGRDPKAAAMEWDRRVHKSLRLLREGEDGRALNTLSQLDLAPADDTTLEKLWDLHPPASPSINVAEEGRPSSFLEEILQQTQTPIMQLKPKEVTRALFSSRSCSAPGPSGMGFGDLKKVGASKEGRAILTKIVNAMLEGRIPSGHPLRDSTLIALDKGAGKVRPISVGESLYRLCGRAVLKTHGNNLADILAPHQFGVNIKGGSESIIHLVQSKMRQGPKTVVCMDLKNAFNTVDRTHMRESVRTYAPELLDFFVWDYGRSLTAYWDNCAIESQCGVKQGCPLSPFFFCLALKDILAETSEAYPDVEVMAYLDDITLVGESGRVAAVFSCLSSKLKRIGLLVNPGKTQLLFPEQSRFEASKAWTGLLDEPLLEEALKKEHGIRVLGVPFGPFLTQIGQLQKILLQDNVKLQSLEKAEEQGLPAQAVMRLLCNCISRQANYWMRCMRPSVVSGCLENFKNRLYGFVKRALQQTTELSPEIKTRVDLPVKVGGLGWGVLSADIAYMSAYVASMKTLNDVGKVAFDNPFFKSDGDEILQPKIPEWLKPTQRRLAKEIGEVDTKFQAYTKIPNLQHHLTNKLHQIHIKNLEENENINPVLKSLWACASSRNATAWVYAAPRKGFILDPTEYAKALRLLLGLPQTDFKGKTYLCCKTAKKEGSRVDNLLHHALSCGAEGHAGLMNKRHNALCRILQRAFQEVKIPYDAEVPVVDGRMDIIAHADPCEWLIDVVVTNPMSDGALKKNPKNRKLWAAKDAENVKFGKYKDLKENDRMIIPFAIEATGGFGDSADKLLKLLGRLHRVRCSGLKEVRNFRKLIVAKLSVCLMRYNVYMMDWFLGSEVWETWN